MGVSIARIPSRIILVPLLGETCIQRYNEVRTDIIRAKFQSDSIKQTYRTLGSCTILPPKQRGQRRRRYSLGRLSPSLPGPSGNGSDCPGKGGEEHGGGDEAGDEGGNGDEGGKGDVATGEGGGRDIDGWFAINISW